MRLLLFFVLAIGIVVLLVGAIGAAVAPPPPTANCPDPRVPCAPAAPATLNPNAPNGAGTGAPRPTAIRPGTVGGPIGALPSPRAQSNAAKQALGTTWSSSSMGFTIEYDAQIWSIGDEGSNGLFLTAGNGSVALTLVGYQAGEVSARDAFQREVDRLSDTVLGLTEEPDDASKLPGTPIIGYEPGVGSVYTGTLNSPQGPGSNVSVAVLAASDSQITILVSVISVDKLREPAFHAADSILNSVRWPGRAP
jgi:hypothetical protein